MKKNRPAALANLLTAILLILSSYLSQILGVGEPIGSDVANQVVLLLPADFSFSIWGVLFILIICFAVFQILPLNLNLRLLEPIRKYSAATFLIASIWAVLEQILDLEHYDIFFIGSSLITAHLALKQIYQYKGRLTKHEIYFVYVPISALTGWISIATLATLCSYIKFGFLNNFGLSDTSVSIALLFLSVIAFFLYWRKLYYNKILVLPVIWGLFGIAWRNLYEYFNANVVYAVGLILIFFCYCLFKKIITTKQYVYRR